MKKALLFILPFLVTSVVMAQNERLISKIKQLKEVEASTEFVPKSLGLDVKQDDYSKAAASIVYYGTDIGDTYYDLQVNGGASPTNITQYDDGSIAITYTHIDDTSAGVSGPNRGTAYAYFDAGTQTWSLEQDPMFGIFDERVGWGCIGNSTSGEIVIAHGNSPTQMISTSRAAKGTGAWSASTTYFGEEYLWPRMAVAGDTLHLIGSCNSCPNGPVDGINNMMWYSRSVDGGQTFDISMQILPGTDTINFPVVPFSTGPNMSFTDGYQIDVRGNTVAIVAGGGSYSMGAWKSVDGGDSWTFLPIADRTELDTSNGQGYVDPNTGNTRIFHPAGDPNVVIDNNDQIHIFSGAIEQSWDSVFTWAGRAASSGILYWNESMLGSRPTSISDMLMDINCDQTLGYSLDDASTGGYSIDNGASQGVTSAVDANGNIFIVTSSIVEDTYDFIRSVSGNQDSIHIRDLYLLYSTDGGQSWSYPINIASQIDGFVDNLDSLDVFKGTSFAEDVYPSLVKHVGSDNTLHLYFQTDESAGLRAPATPTQLSATVNNAVYYSMDINTVLATQGFNTDSCELNFVTSLSSEFENVKNISAYPNPVSEILTISVDLKVKGDFEISIVDLVGREIKSERGENISSGINQVQFDLSDITSGVYIYKVNTGDKIYSNKFIKE